MPGRSSWAEKVPDCRGQHRSPSLPSPPGAEGGPGGRGGARLGWLHHHACRVLLCSATATGARAIHTGAPVTPPSSWTRADGSSRAGRPRAGSSPPPRPPCPQVFVVMEILARSSCSLKPSFPGAGHPGAASVLWTLVCGPPSRGAHGQGSEGPGSWPLGSAGQGGGSLPIHPPSNPILHSRPPLLP